VDRLNEEIVEIRNTKAELQQEHNRKLEEMHLELEDLKGTYENELNNVWPLHCSILCFLLIC
jgi:hypothetical protein